MKGTRVYLNEDNELLLKEGEYGQGISGVWLCRPFKFYTGSLLRHDIIEHEDGTITVSPSILIQYSNERWHGYLIKGIWTECI